MIIRTTEMDAALLAALHELWPRGTPFDVETVSGHCVRLWLATGARGAEYRSVAARLAEDPLWQALQFLRPRIWLRGQGYALNTGRDGRLDEWLGAVAGHEIAGFRLERDAQGGCRIVKSTIR